MIGQPVRGRLWAGNECTDRGLQSWGPVEPGPGAYAPIGPPFLHYDPAET